MKACSIGIVGGAGPLAGVLLLERLFLIARNLYGCYKDSDFPCVFFLSFPFSDMLSSEIDEKQIQKELSDCLSQLRANGANILAIACNTLHAFIDKQEDLSDIVCLPKVVAEFIPSTEIPIILCTSTLKRKGLYDKFFSCTYPDSKTQVKVDQIINRILCGEEAKSLVYDLRLILQAQKASTVILGCTELSLFSGQLSFDNRRILDPLNLVAQKLLEKAFSFQREKVFSKE